jgi:hypothetical protein
MLVRFVSSVSLLHGAPTRNIGWDFDTKPTVELSRLSWAAQRLEILVTCPIPELSSRLMRGCTKYVIL